MWTSTLLVYRHACTLFNLSLWLHQEVSRWSHWHWAKQLTLSWQNGFHHSMCITPLICLLHPSEEQAYMWQLFPVLSGSKKYWNEMNPYSMNFSSVQSFFWGAKILFWKLIMGSCEISVATFWTLNCFPY